MFVKLFLLISIAFFGWLHFLRFKRTQKVVKNRVKILIITTKNVNLTEMNFSYGLQKMYLS